MFNDGLDPPCTVLYISKNFIHIKISLHGHVAFIEMDLWQVHNPIWFQTHVLLLVCAFSHVSELKFMSSSESHPQAPVHPFCFSVSR